MSDLPPPRGYRVEAARKVQNRRRKEDTHVELRNLKLGFDSFTNGGPAILQGIAPAHPFRDGKQVKEEICGRKVTVVFPENKYDSLTVTVADPTDALTPLLDRATASAPVYVAFDGFSATVYAMRGADGQFRSGISAKADKVRVVDASDAIIDIEI